VPCGGVDQGVSALSLVPGMVGSGFVAVEIAQWRRRGEEIVDASAGETAFVGGGGRWRGGRRSGRDGDRRGEIRGWGRVGCGREGRGDKERVYVGYRVEAAFGMRFKAEALYEEAGRGGVLLRGGHGAGGLVSAGDLFCSGGPP